MPVCTIVPRMLISSLEELLQTIIKHYALVVGGLDLLIIIDQTQIIHQIKPVYYRSFKKKKENQNEVLTLV